MLPLLLGVCWVSVGLWRTSLASNPMVCAHTRCGPNTRPSRPFKQHPEPRAPYSLFCLHATKTIAHGSTPPHAALLCTCLLKCASGCYAGYANVGMRSQTIICAAVRAVCVGVWRACPRPCSVRCVVLTVYIRFLFEGLTVLHIYTFNAPLYNAGG